MTALVAFIASYLGAAIFRIANGVPFTPSVIIWINFLVQVPLAIAMGFDDPSSGLMERKPRPLKQPVLSRAQWRHIIALGLLMTIATLVLEVLYTPAGNAVMYTMGFAVFSLMNIAMTLAVRSETDSALTRDIITNRQQLLLLGLSLLFTLLPTELGFLSSRFGLTSLNMVQWLICLGFAIALLLITEVIKVFKRRRSATQPAPAVVAGTTA
jgi:Ca2+-transporting ATPase